jgi:allantoate deiminase
MALPPVDPEYIERVLDDLYRIGSLPEGGVFRPAFGEAWMQARGYVASRMRELGLKVWEDAVGNLFGRLEGSEESTVITGSHIDTVRGGGRLDGALGIVGALAAVSVLGGLGRPRRNVEVVATCEEEGSRFPAKMPGSRAMAGNLTLQELEAVVDGDGISVAEAMRRCGFEPEKLQTARRQDVVAFLELHIEQGPKLEETGHQVGIVEGIVGLTHLEITVTGRADHAGTTPMSRRKDALMGAAIMMQGVEALARSAGDPAVATVGRVGVWPGSINVVPGRVAFTVDVRHLDEGKKRQLIHEILAYAGEVASQRDLRMTSRVLAETQPTAMDRDLADLLQVLAAELGIDAVRIPSGAAHDAQMMAAAFPSAMIFVPSRDGRSHCPEEFTPIDQIVPGVQLLAEALHRLAY